MTRWWVATRMFSEGNLRSCVSGHRKLPERGQQLQRRSDHAECTGAHRSCAGADLPIPTTEELPARRHARSQAHAFRRGLRRQDPTASGAGLVPPEKPPGRGVHGGVRTAGRSRHNQQNVPMGGRAFHNRSAWRMCPNWTLTFDRCHRCRCQPWLRQPIER